MPILPSVFRESSSLSNNTFMEEQEPGVYTRGEEPVDELDFLWDKERRKSRESEKFNMWFFLAGGVCGALVSSAIFMLLSLNHAAHAPAEESPKTSAAVEEKVLKASDLPKAPSSAEQEDFTAIDQEAPPIQQDVKAEPAKIKSVEASPKVVETKPTVTTTTSKPTIPVATTAGQTTYEVKPGDTLGGIAYRYYHEDAPNMVDDIQKANGMKSPHSLQVGQKLIIPAKR